MFSIYLLFAHPLTCKKTLKVITVVGLIRDVQISQGRRDSCLGYLFVKIHVCFYPPPPPPRGICHQGLLQLPARFYSGSFCMFGLLLYRLFLYDLVYSFIFLNKTSISYQQKEMLLTTLAKWIFLKGRYTWSNMKQRSVSFLIVHFLVLANQLSFRSLIHKINGWERVILRYFPLPSEKEDSK